ncbi:MAG: hypothetical protein SPL30_06725 [Succinivibrio sp.]|jgi:hypothetical protein|nr:hypothetical protein [Succinivibrio sp.]
MATFGRNNQWIGLNVCIFAKPENFGQSDADVFAAVSADQGLQQHDNRGDLVLQDLF